MPHAIPAAFRRGQAAGLRPRAAVQSADGGVVIRTPDQLDRYLREGADGSAAGVAVTPESAMRVGAVYGCVRVLAGAVATLPLTVKRRVSAAVREDVDDHPVSVLLRRRPNGWMRPAEFKRMGMVHLLLRGNFYCLKVRNFRGQVAELWPLNPDRVTPVQAADKQVSYRYARPDGGFLVLPAADVWHLRGMTVDGIVGLSVLSAAREAIGLSLAIGRHGATFFKNGTHVGSVITYPEVLGTEGQESLRASLEAYRGAENAHKTLILEEGAALAKLSMSQIDAQFVESLGATRTEICMFFGVPPHMIGDTSKATSWGSGIEQQGRGFVAYTLEDWLSGWEEAADVDLLVEPDLYALFNRAALVRGDIKTRWAAHVQGLQWGVLSPDEVRAMEDMNPRPDGAGGVFYPPPNTAGGTKPEPDEKADDEPPAEPPAD